MYVIDDSTITWEMIEEDMQKEYSIQLKTGPKRLAERIGKGKGFLSRIYRLDFDWEIEGNLSANDRKPPEKCALKVSTLDVIKELFDNVGSGQKKHLAEYYAASLSNNELFFYQNIAKLGFDELRIPKYYCGREYSEETGIGYLAMEIMEGSIVQHIYENLSGKQILEILYQMALLNGSSLYHTEQLQSFIDSKFFDQFLEDFNTKDVNIGRFNTLKATENYERNPSLHREFPEVQGKIGNSFAGSRNLRQSESLSGTSEEKL
ncbi:unnamed protein product, partial [Mesorhabditis belari]|uniref:Uncharacterized protein n=1 Tax=Mesorhabditis belari TaxID=2138241 RepID=A0AAF3EQ17_9BILA